MLRVKLPKDVLRLFPEWEYQCPTCGSYVETEISECPNCKTGFNDETWRVPPRFLKSPELMSDYAHKVLAPKLTDTQRKLLFRYFTEFFVDGFESGDFSQWTSSAVHGSDPEAVIEVVDSWSHHGSYSCHAHVSDLPGYTHATIRKSLPSSYTEVYVRAYVKVNSHQLTNNTNRGYWINPRNSSNGFLAWCGLRNVSGTVRFELMGRNGASYVSNYGSEVETGKTYCIEVHWTYGESATIELYVDGALDASLSGIDTTNFGLCNEVYTGITETYRGMDVNVDCVVVADTYIGPEATEQTRAFNLDAAFQKRDNTKSFALDAVFAYKVRLPELWLTENGKLVLNISKPYTWVGT